MRFVTAIPLTLIISLSGSIQPAYSGAANCSVSATSLSFGSIILSSSSVDVTGTISVTCPSGAGPSQYSCVSIGAGSSSDATSRIMINGANQLRFDLYQDAARTIRWGSWETGYAGNGVQTVVAKGTTVDLTVYGRVFGSQTSPPALYTSSFAAGVKLTNTDSVGPISCPTSGNSATASFTATADVTPSCTVSAGNLNFGSAGLLNAAIDASATMSVNCTSTTPYNVGLDAGQGVSATVAARKMTNGAAAIIYSLYTNSSRTAVWGNTVGSNAVGGTGTGGAQTYTVYGRVPAQTTPAPATYSDSVIVTVTY